MTTDEALHAYYERDKERDRLAEGIGELEYLRTTEIIARTLPPAPAVVADIGGGPGRYTDWLIGQGYTVIHRDVVPHHVEQVQARYSDSRAVASALGDACDLGDIADATVDAVLLLGPLYHLYERTQRQAAIAEAARIARPGGMVYAAAIGRWAARVAGMLGDRMYVPYPETLQTIDAVEQTGVLRPVIEGGFTGYAHTPDELRSEVGDADGLELISVLAVEGVISAYPPELVAARMEDDQDREVMLESLRALEEIPDIVGSSSHLLAVARRT